MSESIAELVDGLDESSVTVHVLHALDFVVPGEWENLIGLSSRSGGYPSRPLARAVLGDFHHTAPPPM